MNSVNVSVRQNLWVNVPVAILSSYGGLCKLYKFVSHVLKTELLAVNVVQV